MFCLFIYAICFQLFTFALLSENCYWWNVTKEPNKPKELLAMANVCEI